MAGAPPGLSPVVDATVAKVIAVATEQLNLAWGWKADLQSFCRIMKMLRSVLQDADEKNLITTHSHLGSWLLELRDIADEADDVLEEVSYENLRRQMANQIPKWKKVSYFFSRSNPLVFRLRMANKVRSLNLTLANINDSAIRLGLQPKLATMGSEPVVDPQQTTSFLPSQVIGREKDVSEIESLLLNSTSSQEQELLVIAIVGMAGLGKTTLAKKVSKAEKILEKFGEHVIWVSVSTNFENKLILREMVGSSTDESSAEIAVKKIQEKLGEKCYLLILDDVWNEERKKWEDLRSCLLGINKNKGNRVLVTTRSEDVAAIMTTDTDKHIIRPAKMTEEECWAVIKDRAFGRSSVPQNLREVGQEISKKCKGVPLVASLIGATLQNKRNKREWQSVLQNHVWHSLERENGVLDVIRLSYDRLPELALKQCFAFCSVFPKDFDMEKEVLIQLWMAEGYLSSSEGSSARMEDIGEKYYRYLLSYSLFQEESMDYNGEVTCKMHDLIHDFAESISTSETAILDKESENKLPSSIRHLNLIDGGKMMPTISGDVAPKLRTVLFLKHDDASNGLQQDYKRLRVLKISKASDGRQLSKCFGNSKSLRYLDISGTKVEEFPKFIKKLYNLQTFRFVNCRSLRMPPDGLRNLINLRHIYFDDEDHMPVNLGRLLNLQTLGLFFVGTTKGRTIEELGSLSRLKGKLDIRKLKLVKGKSEAESAKLHEKELYELLLYWSWNISESGDCDEDVLEGLQPHSSLQKLHLEDFGGERLASWMESGGRFHLNNLVVLRLESCAKLKSIPLMEEFSSLEELYIRSCGELINGEFALQSLKKLSINYCPKVESFTFSGLTSLEELEINECGVVNIMGDDLSSCTRLRLLELERCCKLKNVPNLHGLSSLQKVRIEECDEIACLPSGLSSCIALEVLSIKSCPSLVSIPEELKRLHSLVELRIWECSKLSSFPEEMLGFLSKLKTLVIGGFSNELEEFPGFSSIHLLNASSLQTLHLVGWEKLTQLPHQIQALTALKSLDIHGFNGVKALPEWLGQLSSLETLTVIDCSGLKSLPNQLSFCTGLENLNISYCNNLISVPRELKELRSLGWLYIYRCPKLKSFPEEILGGLTCLKTLLLGPFSEDLEEFIGLSSIHHNLHSSLEHLGLDGWEKLTQLPQQIQHLTALRTLIILNFNGVEALPDWLGGNSLPSLQSLYILNCENLKILPSTEVIKRLSKLNIYTDWPELEEKIQQEKQSRAVE